MAKSNESDNEKLAQLNKLNAIKEIIFGEEKQSLDLKLAELEEKFGRENELIQKEIKSLHDSLSSQIEALKGALVQQMNQQQEALKEKISRMDHKKVNKADLGDLLIALGKQLKE